LFLIAIPVARALPPPPVQSALAALKQGSAKLASGWRYKETITSSKGKTQLTYDPSRRAGERWAVVKVNGKTSDEAARKRLKARTDKRSSASGKLGVGSGWLATSDYKLLKKTPTTLVYQLHPNVDAASDKSTAKLLGHLAGELVIARDGHRPLSLKLDNFESFSPKFGVKINAFGFRAKFKRLADSGPVVVIKTSNFARGKVFWIKGFKDKTEVELSDFTPVAASAPVPQTGG
jgi:hypothetical protein